MTLGALHTHSNSTFKAEGRGKEGDLPLIAKPPRVTTGNQHVTDG